MTPHDMDCPECTEKAVAMPGSSWAIAWYSCGRCGTFWYARLRVGKDADYFDRPALPAGSGAAGSVAAGSVASASMPAVSLPAPRHDWTIEELEAEADALRRESDTLPKGDLEALRLHLEKLKILADAINQRLDSHSAQRPRVN